MTVVVFKLYRMVNIYRILTYYPEMYGRKKEALNQLRSLSFSKLSESNKNSECIRRRRQRTALCNAQATVGIPPARKNCEGVESVNDLISLENTALSGERGLLSRE